VGIQFVSQRDMRGPPATTVHDFRFRCASIEGLGNPCPFRGLVSDAFMRDVVLGEESLQVFLRGRGADGLVKNRDGMAGLASKLKIHKRLIFCSRAKFQLKTPKVQLCDADRT
jgi:hypothetical protein